MLVAEADMCQVGGCKLPIVEELGMVVGKIARQRVRGGVAAHVLWLGQGGASRRGEAHT